MVFGGVGETPGGGSLSWNIMRKHNIIQYIKGTIMHIWKSLSMF